MSGLSRHHVLTSATVRSSVVAKRRPAAHGWRGWGSAPTAAQNRSRGRPATALPLVLVGGGLLGMGIAHLLCRRTRTATVEEPSPAMAFLLPLFLGAGALAVAGWADARATSIPAGDTTTPEGAAPTVAASAGRARSGRASTITHPDRWARPVPIMRVCVPSETGAGMVDSRNSADVCSVRIPANAGFMPDQILAVVIHRDEALSTETAAQRPPAIIPAEDKLASTALTSCSENNPAPVDAHTNASGAVDKCGARASEENNPAPISAPIPAPIPALVPSSGHGEARAADAPREQKTVCDTSLPVLAGSAERFSAVRRNLPESPSSMCSNGSFR